MCSHASVRLEWISTFATSRESVSFHRPDRSVTEFGAMRVTVREPLHAIGSSAMIRSAPAREKLFMKPPSSLRPVPFDRLGGTTHAPPVKFETALRSSNVRGSEFEVTANDYGSCAYPHSRRSSLLRTPNPEPRTP